MRVGSQSGFPTHLQHHLGEVQIPGSPPDPCFTTSSVQGGGFLSSALYPTPEWSALRRWGEECRAGQLWESTQGGSFCFLEERSRCPPVLLEAGRQGKEMSTAGRHRDS